MKKYVGLISLLIVLIAALLIYRSINTPLSTTSMPTENTTSTQEQKFTGTITKAYFGCEVDRSCDLVLDDKVWVHFGHDTRLQAPSEWGNADSLWVPREERGALIGKKVEVYAAGNALDGYTIKGKKEYYIRLVK
jgi:hypothetical protein